MKCPECSTTIAWWRVATITRWTFVRCPKCSTLCGRNINGQMWLVFGGFALAVFALRQLELSRAAEIGAFLLLLVLMIYLDARTIMLVRQPEAPKRP